MEAWIWGGQCGHGVGMKVGMEAFRWEWSCWHGGVGMGA